MYTLTVQFMFFLMLTITATIGLLVFLYIHKPQFIISFNDMSFDEKVLYIACIAIIALLSDPIYQISPYAFLSWIITATIGLTFSVYAYRKYKG